MNKEESREELIQKIKINEKSRRRMQKSLMQQIEQLKAEIDLLNDNRIYLNKKIDKAIEYLKENEDKPIYLDCKFYETKEYKDLLEILRGKE